MSNDLIERAITRLEQLKAESTQGDWGPDLDAQSGDWDGPSSTQIKGSGVTLWGDDPETVWDAKLIIALHRTIDAQLSILRFAVEYDRPRDSVVALAKAILGE